MNLFLNTDLSHASSLQTRTSSHVPPTYQIVKPTSWVGNGVTFPESISKVVHSQDQAFGLNLNINEHSDWLSSAQCGERWRWDEQQWLMLSYRRRFRCQMVKAETAYPLKHRLLLHAGHNCILLRLLIKHVMSFRHLSVVVIPW